MRLVVVGAYHLDELQKRVVECFSNVPNLPRVTLPLPVNTTNTSISPLAEISTPSTTAKTTYTWDDVYTSPMCDIGMPFTEKSLQKIFYICPVKDRHALSISWQIPSQMHKWKAKPCDFLAHLLGHEAKGSILASLKAKSWATACCAGVGSEGYEVRNTL